MRDEQTRIDADIVALTKAGQKQERVAMKDRVRSLKARQFLHDNSDAIRAEVVRKKLLQGLDQALSKTNPSSISRQSSVLTQKHVTETLQDRFKAHLRKFFGDRKIVSFNKARTKLGTTYFRINLIDAQASAKLGDVVSEGEFRAIGLAAFLAELDQEPAHSAAVFDDPVTSLDHRYRAKAAEVLVKLASERQVVVFTHDLFFLSCLWGEAHRFKVPISPLEVQGADGAYGYSASGVPIEIRKLKVRRKAMASTIHKARKALKDKEMEIYQSLSLKVAREMRLAIERAVEEVLFNDAVCRFDKDIHTEQLKPTLVHIVQTDIDLIVRLMDKYNPYFHDQAPDTAVGPPDIGDMEQDLKTLVDWADEFRKRA